MEDSSDRAASFLGRGWSFPPGFGPATGDVVMTEGEADIDGSLRILFGTALGERFLVPAYGLDMHELQFEPISTGLRTFLRDRIKIAILIYEPRIAIESLEVGDPTDFDGMLRIVLQYTVRATNSRYNLVYPFYVTDASEVAPSCPGR